MKDENKKAQYSEKEGQYLAFIFYYSKINGIAPAQADFQRYFSVSPPTVHQTILQLEKKGLIHRIPNAPRSITLLIEKYDLPNLR